FSMLTTRRRDSHAQRLHALNAHYAYYRTHPHPSEIAAADAELKRGIDDDWKASVQRYPEVLEYFYGLVRLDLPGDDEPGVRDPPLSALGGGAAFGGMGRKVRVQEPRERERRERRRSVAPPPMPPQPPRAPSRPQTAFAPMQGYGYVPPGY
ncbi:hypothetical protein LAWI1_G004550, partial [Lachnellula willkommii]